MGEYTVRCVSDGKPVPAFSLVCPYHDSLLRADYTSKCLELRALPGIWRFYDWLPVHGIIPEAGEAPITYKSQGLAAELGLETSTSALAATGLSVEQRCQPAASRIWRLLLQCRG